MSVLSYQVSRQVRELSVFELTGSFDVTEIT